MNIENIQRGLCHNEEYYQHLSLAVCHTQETLDPEWQTVLKNAKRILRNTFPPFLNHLEDTININNLVILTLWVFALCC